MMGFHMLRSFCLIVLASLTLAACTETAVQLGPDGKPLPKLYRIRAGDVSSIQFRMLDSVNALRQAAGQAPVEMNAQLNAAAATHALDMSRQNRPWHFGSDGSSPLDRVARVGYTGALVGENISETYETEIETLGAWMETPDTRRVITAPEAGEMGFAWHQESNGKIWWTLVMGDPQSVQVVSAPIPDADLSGPTQ